MFTLQPNPTFKADVDITIPGSKPAKIGIEFKHLKRSERDAFVGRARDGADDRDLLGEVVVGWTGVDQPYSRDALATLLENYPGAGLDIFMAFIKAHGSAAAKN